MNAISRVQRVPRQPFESVCYGPSRLKSRSSAFSKGATRATGTVAIIDVFRAFTTAAVALANGASKIVMVGAVEEAFKLREAGIGQIMRETDGARDLDRDVSETIISDCSS